MKNHITTTIKVLSITAIIGVLVTMYLSIKNYQVQNEKLKTDIALLKMKDRTFDKFFDEYMPEQVKEFNQKQAANNAPAK